MAQRFHFDEYLQDKHSQRSSIQCLMPPKMQKNSAPEDVEYRQARKEILASTFLKNAGQHVRIRIQGWIQRLDRIKSNKVWIANRNNYIKLLSLMCHCEFIACPFNQLPPQRDLLNLQKHDITKIIDEIEREVKTSRLPSRKSSIHIDNAKIKSISTNFNIELKRFKTETNTCGEEDGDTVLLRNLTGVRTFQTDFDEKTISFKLSSDNQMLNHPFENSEGQESSYFNQQPSRSISQANYFQLKEISNFENRTPLQYLGSSTKKQGRNPSVQKDQKSVKQTKSHSKKSSKSVLQQKSETSKKEYWESNELTGNNSGAGTPKYMDHYQWSEQKMTHEVEIVSHRGTDENCDCTSKVLGQGWLSQFFKKLSS